MFVWQQLIFKNIYMDPKLTNYLANQSSQSDISEGEDQSHNRITMLNHNRKEYLKHNFQASANSDEDQLSSDQSSDDQAYQHHMAQSNSNPKFTQNNFHITRGVPREPINVQQPQSDEDEDEDEDDEDQNDSLEVEKINTRQAQIKVSHEQESDSDSEQEEQDYNKYPLGKIGNGIQTVRQDSQQDSDEASIDYLEERIKKLNRDLENRLGKASNKKIPNKPSKTKPPIPNQPKIGTIAASSKIRPNNDSKISVSIHNEENNNQNKMNAMNEAKKMSLPISTMNPKVKKIEKVEISGQIVKKNIEVKKKTKKNKKNPQSNPQISKALSNPDEPNKDQLQLLHKKIAQMQEQMKRLNLQNKQLRTQLSQPRQLEPLKSKKKPLQELQKLKEFSKTSKNSKLEKQIQLLQVLEKLQGKLKKSVSRKLLQGKGSSSVALLHKGLPASFLDHL